jgi:8-oxo-dGTP diphosphatase
MNYFTPEEQNAYYNKQPAKRNGSPVLIFNQRGDLLLVKPSYKPGWSPVGGVTEAGESPLTAAVRETAEETGLHFKEQDLQFVGVRYIAPRNDRNDEIQTYFAVTISDEQAKTIVAQEDEIATCRFIPQSELATYADTPRIQAIVAALPAVNAGAPFYLENETRVL